MSALRLVPTSCLDRDWDSDVFVHDVRKGLPFENNSLSAVYSSHMLEHLYFEEARRLLDECYRILEPRGVLRIVVPDLGAIVADYCGGTPGVRREQDARDDVYAADRLMERLLMRKPCPPSGSLAFRAYTALKDFHSHKWMYDGDSLSGYFGRAGFVDIGHKEFRESLITGIEEVEMPDRVLNGNGICVEGVKPE
jgi:ubiquinone/menaquinone biosynthesis C-methylase UbiE